MTWPARTDRDATQIDALIADRYLEALLAAGDRRADDVPADAALDPELRAAARALRRAFVRVHPSFRFEERLAGRLAELAATQRAARQAGVAGAAPARPGTLIPFQPAPARLTAIDPDLPAILAGSLDPAAPVGSAAPVPAPRAGAAGAAPGAAAAAAGAAASTDAAMDRPGLAADAARMPHAAVSRPVILGGAVASAAISLAGVAIVAWRAARPPRHAAGPMARAARAAHGRRLATATAVAVAGTGRTA